MLQKIHSSIKGWVAVVIFGLIALTFMMWGVQYYLNSSHGKNEVLAKVGNVSIRTKDFMPAYGSYAKQLQQRSQSPISASQRHFLQQMVLNSMVQQSVMTQSRQALGLRIGLPMVQQVLAANPSFQGPNHQFSMERYKRYLMYSGMTESELIARVRLDLGQQQLERTMAASSFVLPQEIQQAYRQLYQQRDVAILALPLAPFIHKAHISTQQIQHFYQANKAEYKTPEQLSIQYLKLSPVLLQRSVTISPAQVKQYYKQNQGNYAVPAQYQLVLYQVTVAPTIAAHGKPLQVALSKIRQQLAQHHSEAPQTAGISVKTVSTRWYAQGQLPANIASIVPMLKTHQVSIALRNTAGYQLVKLLDKKAETLQSFHQVKQKVRQLLTHQAVAKLFAQKSDQLDNLTYTTPDSLQPAAKALGLSIQSTPLFSRQAKVPGFTDPNIHRVAFSDNVLQQGNNSNPITLKDGSIVVLRRLKHVLSQAKPLSAIKPAIKQRLQQQQASRQAGVLIYRWQTAVEKGKSIAAQLHAYQAHWRQYDHVKRQQPVAHLSPMVQQAIFSLSPAHLKQQSAVTSVQLPDGSYVLVKLTKVQYPSFSAISPKNKQSVEKQVLQSQAHATFMALTAHWAKQVKVKYYPAVLKGVMN